MDKTVAGLIGAVGALAASPSHAAPRPIEAALQARSYAELLAPIPNALVLASAAQASPIPAISAQAPIEPAQLIIEHHHHHHRYRHYRRRYHHHHHHHHHHHNNHD